MTTEARDEPRPCLARARERASALVDRHVIDGFAQAFPDQVAHAVLATTAALLRERPCCSDGLVAA